MASIKFLKECFDYFPETGALLWRSRPAHHFKSEFAQKAWNGRYAGKVAGTLRTHHQRPDYRYWHVKVDGKMLMAHRVVWAIHYGAWPDQSRQVDHIDGNPENNRISNLRLVSHYINGRNQRLHKNNSTGISGVSWHKRDGRFQVCIRADGETLHLGVFETLLDAASARKSAERTFGYHKNHGSRRGQYT